MSRINIVIFRIKIDLMLLLLFQMLLRIQRQLDHPLEKFVCLQSWKIVANEFLAKQAANIAQLAALLFAGIYKVPVPVVNDNHVFFLIES